jgi:extracellular elastinolytic metalloproteinase
MKKITSLLMILFTVVGFSQDNKGKIQDYLNRNKTSLNLTSQDISDWTIESTGSSESTKITNYYIKQRYQGIEIFNALTNVWVKDNEVINAGNRFYNNISQKANTITPSLSVSQALNKAFIHLNLASTENNIIETISDKEFKLSNGSLSDDPIKAELVFQPVNQSLRLAWDYNFYTQDYKHLWSVRIDAVTGDLLEKNDMVISCNFENHKGHKHGAADFSFYKNFYKDQVASPFQVQGGSYRVVPYNYESPNHSARQLIANPENATASPKGWHDTNTIAGTTATLKYTYLRGNNVWSRADYTGTNSTAHSTNATTNGYSPDGGTALLFDYPYGGTGVAANTYINAASTNLFYMNNIMHDVWYQYGFNELAGNFQQTNHVGGASANDFVWGDAQDASTAATPQNNNANFSTQPDGTKPRMQMFLWNVGPIVKPLYVVNPSTIEGNYNSRQNGFSPGHVDLPIAPAFLQTDLVLYEDGTQDPGTNDGADACNPAINAAALDGKIVLVRRSLAELDGGTPCSFTVKVKNAQNAGAIAVIVYNNVDVLNNAGNPSDVALGMSGADASITIPAIGISKIVGDMLVAQMLLGPVTVKLQLPSDYAPFVNADGDFDNGIIAHEYGHGISNRLTGGRLTTSCLNNAEQMGEGWSDWFALMMQLKVGDVGTSARGIGTFAVSEAITGGGIRNFPYSTDMSINPLTFVDSNDDESHNRGEFMTAVLWDLTWEYINKYGHDANTYTGTGGNNKVMRLVIDGLKLQPCSPSLIEFRDAIIAADQATTGGQDFCLIWKVFANRGVGVNASSGSNDDALDQTEDFSVPAPGPNCTLSVNYFENEDSFRVYPNPTNDLLNVRINNYVGKVNIQVIDINGRIVKEYKNEEFNIEKSLNLNNLQSGMYVLKVNGDNLNFIQKIIKN